MKLLFDQNLSYKLVVHLPTCFQSRHKCAVPD
jgi:hypothetical protein